MWRDGVGQGMSFEDLLVAPACERRQAGDNDLGLNDILVSPAEQEEPGGGQAGTQFGVCLI